MLLANFNGKEHLRHRAVSLRQHGFLVFGKGYLFYLFFVVKNTAVQYSLNVKWCHLIWTILWISDELR